MVHERLPLQFGYDVFEPHIDDQRLRDATAGTAPARTARDT